MKKTRQELWYDFNHNGFDFVMADIETATLFAQRAMQSRGDSEKRRRCVTNARKGYDTVIRIREKLKLDSDQQRAFDEKRINLKNALEQLGENF